jgi:hypothetical protein
MQPSAFESSQPRRGVPARASASSELSCIGRELASLYGDALAAPLPEAWVNLLQDLDRAITARERRPAVQPAAWGASAAKVRASAGRSAGFSSQGAPRNSAGRSSEGLRPE